jgi:hypothetical protein
VIPVSLGGISPGKTAMSDDRLVETATVSESSGTEPRRSFSRPWQYVVWLVAIFLNGIPLIIDHPYFSVFVVVPIVIAASAVVALTKAKGLLRPLSPLLLAIIYLYLAINFLTAALYIYVHYWHHR